MNNRELEIQKVSAALPPLKRIDELYVTATNLAQQMTAVQTTAKAKNSHKGTIAGGLAVFATWMAMDVVVLSLVAVTKNLVIGVVGAVCAILACIHVYKNVKKKLGEDDKHTTETKSEYSQAMEQISKEIEQVAINNAMVIEAIPRDYRTYHAVSFFENVLANGRAETMKEAMNLYEDHVHKLRMENMNQQMIYGNNQQIRMMEEINRTTRGTAYAVNLNTAFNVLQYISR